MRPSLVAVLVVSLALAPALALALGEILQPGERLTVPGGLCTMSFAFDGIGPQAGKVYILTAAHCAQLGARVGSFAGEFGTVVARGAFNQSNIGPQTTGCCTEEDYAFIEVDASAASRVRADVKGHPDMPRGVSDDATTADNSDLLQMSGYGVGWTAHNATREQRVGLLRQDTPLLYRCACPATDGDSGGPIADVSSGKAVGLVSGIPIGATWTLEGPTIEHVIYTASVRGLHVQLRTV